MEILGSTAVELVYQPGVDGAERESSLVVSLLYPRSVLDQPQKLARRRVCGQLQTAFLLQVVCTDTCLEFANQLLGSGVRPHDRIVKRLTSHVIPDYRGFTLVGDANGLDALDRVLLLELCNGAINAVFNGGDDFEGIVFVPSR